MFALSVLVATAGWHEGMPGFFFLSSRGLVHHARAPSLCRDKLPDTGSPYEGEGGTVDDSVEFVLDNFVEANKLWVRMHGQVRHLNFS